MKRFLLVVLFLSSLSMLSTGQNVFNPDDTLARYDANQPLGSPKHPDPTIWGLQKWVSTPTNGVSFGTDAYNSSSYKPYFINFNGAQMCFRIKFPKSFKNPDSADKKYPVMLFLHGGGEVGCSTNNGIYNNERPIWLGGSHFMGLVDNNKFDGFLVFPQLQSADGCFLGWGGVASSNFTAILGMIDSMSKYVRADIDRVVVDGLSGGGYGAWRMAEQFPQRIAKIMPSSAAGSTNNRNLFVHIPIWFATGGKDPDPSPAQAQYALNRMKEIGANIRYTIFEERGHNCWYQHWREPDFVPELNDIHKANPLVFFQRNEFCNWNEVNAKLGITQGFYAYEWQRDEQTIASSTNGVQIISDPSSVISYTGNEINVKLFGTYRVRFQRKAGGTWSDWSHKPAVIRSKSATQTVPITINGKKSRVLPSLDGSSTVPLMLPEGFINYQWYRVSDNELVGSERIFNATPGEYRARYAEEYGCGTELSPVFKVVDASGEPKPTPAQQLKAVPSSKTAVRLDWEAGSGATGVEIFRSTASGGPYQFISLLPSGAVNFTDTGLVQNTLYYYVVRTVNESGAAVASNEALAKTISDQTPPTAPSALKATVQNKTTVLLNWNVSTDNDGIARYDIYVNGTKLYSSTTNSYTVTGMDSTVFYAFIVKAVDPSENESPASNQVSVNTKGLTPSYIPGIPSGLLAEAKSYNSILLKWTDTLSQETGFEIVRSATSGGTYLPVGTVAANAISFTDNGLTANKIYYYKIRAIATDGQSAFTTVVSATTFAAPVTPVAPSSLEAQLSENTVSLTWTDNAGNETGYRVYKSTDGVDYILITTLPPNSNAYADNSLSATNYYYVAGVNNSGEGAASDTVTVNAGNLPPVITGISNVSMERDAVVVQAFTVTDQPNDNPTVSLLNKPSFVTLQNTGSGQYSLRLAPSLDHIGSFNMTVAATDKFGKSTSVDVLITVNDKNLRSVFVNLGSNGKLAPAPWNNWLGARGQGDVISNLKDENNVATSFTITTVNAWSGTTDLGHITGNNSGVFPDAVLESGLVDSGEVKQIKINGLSAGKLYNLVFVGSQNEGWTASSEYAYGTQRSVLNARYNTNVTANLNNLSADMNGEIAVTISRTNGATAGFLNALVIEEYDPSMPLLNPSNLFAEQLNRTSVRLTWSDRTNVENSTDGYELVRATDSLFSKNLTVITLAANTTSYTNTALTANTKYWYRVRAKGTGNTYSEYSNRAKIITPESIVYINFNTSTANAASPWNNLATSPLSGYTSDFLKNQSGATTPLKLTLVQDKEFNGEFISGMNTGNNSGVVPDNVLGSDYWLDRQQVAQFSLSGLNHGKRYRFGFIGSSGPAQWFKGNYTATYNINQRTVYLNSWGNTSKIVYIGDVAPDASGKVLMNFSTTAAAGYGFNAGLIVEEYTETPEQVVDTIPDPGNPVDTIPDPGNPVDTIPDPGNPVDTIPDPGNPVDTIPDPGNPVDTIPDPGNPVDTIPDPGNPVDTIPDPGNPVDTIPDPGNPVDTIPDPGNPVDTIPNPGNPVDTIPDPGNPVDTIPDPGNPVDTIPDPGNPVDTIPDPGNPVDTIPDPGNPTDTIPVGPPGTNPGNPDSTGVDDPGNKKEIENVSVYPNPIRENKFTIRFDNNSAANNIDLEIYDQYGRPIFRRKIGQLTTGRVTIPMDAWQANLKNGLYLLSVNVNGKRVFTQKIIRLPR